MGRALEPIESGRHQSEADSQTQLSQWLTKQTPGEEGTWYGPLRPLSEELPIGPNDDELEAAIDEILSDVACGWHDLDVGIPG